MNDAYLPDRAASFMRTAPPAERLMRSRQLYREAEVMLGNSVAALYGSLVADAYRRELAADLADFFAALGRELGVAP